jgi:hypothetical protein
MKKNENGFNNNFFADEKSEIAETLNKKQLYN